MLDEYLSEKCFGKENPLGKVIVIKGQNYSVSAVIKSITGNSHLQFRYLLPLSNLPEDWHRNKWGTDNCIQYLVFNSKINQHDFEKKLTQMLYSKNSIWKDLKGKLFIQPLEEIHLSKGFILDNKGEANMRNVKMISIVALIIFLISVINFTNMFISSSLQQSKSIGVKITSGASRLRLIKEFIWEVVFFVFISFILSVVLIKGFIPVFETITNISIQINIASLNFLLIGSAVVFITIIIASCIPIYFSLSMEYLRVCY
ncbi:MAG: ABC transporter permease [Bacteroidales bacterium]|nr:ABC transporter permease [Bacteroidales bacterium]